MGSPERVASQEVGFEGNSVVCTPKAEPGRSDEWKKILVKINEVLDDAEEKQNTEQSVKMWLGDLQNLAYDVDDLLDELETEAFRRNLMFQEPAAAQTTTTKFRRLIPSCCTNFSPQAIKFDHMMAAKIEDRTIRLQEIEKDKEKEETVKLLLRDDLRTDDGLSVIPIIGTGRIGKTTLAQLAYSDVRVHNHFDLKAWTCVSEDFDIIRVTKSILKSIASDQLVDDHDLNLLQKYNDWTNRSRLFEAGAPGSKIVFTTRNLGVAEKMGPLPAYPLKELSNDDCLSVFSPHSLGEKDFSTHPSLKEIGEKIVKKCNGLPLVAKSLGGLLRDMGNLIKLHHLNNPSTDSLEEMPQGIGKLTSLRTMCKFVVGNEIGSGLRQLKSLIHLQGTVCISRLENVKEISAAKEAQLNGKRNLKDLLLEWNNSTSNIREPETDTCVLDLLKPHQSLKKLKINGYGGTKFAIYTLSITGDSLFSRYARMGKWIPHGSGKSDEGLADLRELFLLKTVTIMFCNALESLPEVWMRDTESSLGSLQIFQCNSFTYIARIELPTSLKRLKVSNFNNLRILTEEEDINSGCNRHTSHLESLEIEDCASLASLLWKNKLSATLERLAVKRCPNLAFLSLSDNLPKALKYLSLHGFSKLESIAERLENTSLEEISIWSCENLKMLPDDLHKLQNLPRFSLGFCNNLISFPRGGLPSTKLNKVDINGSQKLEALPNGMYNLTSLQRLNLGYLPSVVSFRGDGFPPNIDSLVIRDMKICRALFEGGLYRFTSLKRLNISRGCPDVVSFPQKEIGMTLPVSKSFAYCQFPKAGTPVFSC
ncbi:hypothetical protein KPL71_009192 [Citrus sinensis]|uniref:Uncharacterized protein n=1 Tax=Citrus sinensis TaxID=2711 RepID=A0ACB8MDC0_CITSI|nr:hypothetical protein KPL71_009192 [Citrus sinensis]